MESELPDLKPAQIPVAVKTEDDLTRWKVCVALTRLIANRDDWNFALELYNGPLETGDLEARGAGAAAV